MRTPIRLAGLLGAAALMLSPQAAQAWSNQGHMVTGAIAYDDLAAADPGLVSQVASIMAAHPDWPRFQKQLAGLTGADRSRRLFELMARWPDDARGGPYDHPAWHYWLRIVPSTADPAKAPPAFLNLSTGEAREAYRLSLATVRDAFAPAADRGVALCWLFHLAGDMQQPLHAGHLISGRFPLTDRAGESDFVREGDGAPINLHEYWDNAVGGDEDDLPHVDATRLRLEQRWPRSSLAELTGRADAEAFNGWADESLVLARNVAYGGGAFEGSSKAQTAVVVAAAYAHVRAELAGRRVALGGHRIADAVRAGLGGGAS
jgi:hypothetical protein